MYKMEIKKIDSHGRVSMPVSWRKKLRRNEVLVVELDNKVEVISRDADLSKYIDSVEVKVENFVEYHKLKEELAKNEVYRR